jgi:hypothetical protein
MAECCSELIARNEAQAPLRFSNDGRHSGQAGDSQREPESSESKSCEFQVPWE